jgi:hypothetical protein
LYCFSSVIYGKPFWDGCPGSACPSNASEYELSIFLKKADEDFESIKKSEQQEMKQSIAEIRDSNLQSIKAQLGVRKFTQSINNRLHY